jgi:hypothetical protein
MNSTEKFKNLKELSKVCFDQYNFEPSDGYNKNQFSHIERARASEAKDKVGSAVNGTTANTRQLLIPDESTLSRLVAARLDLPISQRLLSSNFKLSIIKRCFEDQLRLKRK